MHLLLWLIVVASDCIRLMLYKMFRRFRPNLGDLAASWFLVEVGRAVEIFEVVSRLRFLTVILIQPQYKMSIDTPQR